MKTQSNQDTPAVRRSDRDTLYSAIENAAQIADKADAIKPTIVAGCVIDGTNTVQMKTNR